MAQPVALPAGQASDAESTETTGRVSSLAGWVVAALAVIQVSLALTLAVLNDLNLERLFSDYFIPQSLICLASAGTGIAIITRKPGNLIGWHFCALSAGAGFTLWLFQYTRYATITNPGMPAGDVAAWLSLWAWAPCTAMLLVLLPLLFPDGLLPGRRWRVAAAMIVVGAVLLSISIAIDPASSSPTVEQGNPIFTSTNDILLNIVSGLAFLLVLPGLALAVAAPVVRYRRSGYEERLQLKWFAFATVLLIAAMVTPAAIDPTGFTEDTLPSAVLLTIALPLLPISVGIAILRYRLYDIDLLINRALVYATLTACVAGLYIFVVGYLSMVFRAGGNWIITLVATGLVAVLFQPLRSWLQLGVNRLLYGERDEPYTVLTRLGQQLEHTATPEATLTTIVQTVTAALKVPYASIWVIDGSILRPGAVQGAGPELRPMEDGDAVRLLEHSSEGVLTGAHVQTSPFAAAMHAAGIEIVLPLFHRGELAGLLCVASRGRNESFSAADRSLLRDLARQAGATVQAAQLTVALRASLDELRRSRLQLVLAQEEERRRIQRDLHDELGPTLAGMRPRIEGALLLARETDPRLVDDLERLDELARQAGADIRRLVHDLRPPALDQLGLVAALRQHVERFGREHGIAATFHTEDALHAPAATEVALFRIVQEALTNVQKHAGASRVTVALRQVDGSVRLEVRDDGSGLPERGEPGAGLRSMRERAELSGGSLQVESQREGGTRVLACIPVRNEDDDE